jgi:heat shock protein HslJ
MISGKRRLAVILTGLLLVVAACAPAGSGVPVTGETATPFEPTGAAPVLPPEAALDAQQWLMEQLNVAVDQVRIVDLEQADWTDSCLGLGRLNESCLQVITPGWRVVFEVNGVTYEVRTDETGDILRLAPSDGVAENRLVNTHWNLVAFGEPGGEQPIAGSNITLLLSDGQAGGYGGCNSYGTTYRVDGGMISFEEITSTLRACADQNMTDQEQRYFEALGSVSRFERVESFLVLMDDAGNPVLTFETPVTVEPIPHILTPES